MGTRVLWLCPGTTFFQQINLHEKIFFFACIANQIASKKVKPRGTGSSGQKVIDKNVRWAPGHPIVHIRVKSKWNTAVGINNCKTTFFTARIYDRKKAPPTAEMMSVRCVAIFWVVNASSCEKSILHFSIPTWFGLGGGGVSHRLKARLNIFSLALSWVLWCCFCCIRVIFNRVERNTMKCKKDSFSGALGGACDTLRTCFTCS